MYIIGTAGHIDHGKTSLIKALSGIDCDRLPEEKAREMTIDIGFAKIDYPKFGTVSIIDVPGHERFIRNMVVGAWGVDVGLLVIAVDDGWMPQTDDHFRVLDLLGIERIIVVLNKIDTADEETIALAEADVLEHLAGTRFEGSDMVKVSAKTGHGIELLKETILKNIRALPKAADAEKPYLFVDRVFSSKGYGTVVTGTLKNGAFMEEDAVTILPQKIEARIKKIESHYSELHQGVPSQRTALNLAGVAQEDLRRGSIVVRNNFFTPAREIFAMLNIRGVTVKNNLSLEIIAGTETLPCRMIIPSTLDTSKSSFPAVLKFEEEWHFYPGEPFIITRPGGFRIVGGGRVILPAEISSKTKKSAFEMAQQFSAFTLENLMSFAIEFNHAMKESTLLDFFPHNKKAIARTIDALSGEGKIKRLGDYVFSSVFYKNSVDSIIQSITSMTGPNIAEIASKTGLSQEFVRLLMPAAAEASPIIEKDGRYFSGDSITEEKLPSDKKKALEDLAGAGIEGIELSKIADEKQKNIFKELIRLRFAISLEGGILYHHAVYDELRDKVMGLFASRDRISIPEVRDVTGLSRKYIIPLLNKIETDGLIKRVGDFRIKS